MVNDHDTALPRHIPRYVSPENKIHVDPMPLTLEEAPKLVWENRLFCITPANPWLPPRAGGGCSSERAARAKARSGHHFPGSMGDGPPLWRPRGGWLFGLGYVTAEDRLEQVLQLYLGVKGELAAAFGPGPVGADKVRPVSAGIYPTQSPPTFERKRFGTREEERLNVLGPFRLAKALFGSLAASAREGRGAVW